MSRAKLGTLESYFLGDNGVRGVSDLGRLVREGFCEEFNLARKLLDLLVVFTGCLRNFASTVAEVGKSSNTSNSLPSPKARRRVGLVNVRLAAASRARDSGAMSFRFGVGGRCWGLESREIGRFSGVFSFEFEELGRKFREVLVVT